MIRIREYNKTQREDSAHYQRLYDLTDRLTMTLTDSNKLSTKVLHKLKVRLSLWLTNPSSTQDNTTDKKDNKKRLKKDIVKHHSTQEGKPTADYHKKKKHTSNKHKQSQDIDWCIN